MTLTQSMEDYLEAIFELDKRKRAVRVKDVAEKLNVTMPSVNGALKVLESKGLIRHARYEYIELTDQGTEQASTIASRHRLISGFLKSFLGVDSRTAEEDACKIEHVLSPATIEKLKEFITRNSRKNNE